MAIINMVDPFTPGSRLYRDSSTGFTTEEGAPYIRLIGLLDTYVGACLSDSERNGRDDSDFYMRVWDEKEQTVKSILFASTRGWSYPCMASRPDATPETLAKVAAWEKKQARRYKAANIRTARKAAADLATRLGLTRGRAARLILACDEGWKLEAATKLLTGNLRSTFRIKLRTQVQDWLKDDAPKYKTPLSPKQWACIHPDAFSYGVPRNGYKAHSSNLLADLRARDAQAQRPTLERLAK